MINGAFNGALRRLGGIVFGVCFCALAVAEDAITKADHSVVRVVVKTSKGFMTGSGFAVGAGGIVATNNHVVDSGEQFWVLSKQENGRLKKYTASVKWVSSDYDLALLKVLGLDIPALTLAEPLPRKGSQVVAIGYPDRADILDGGTNNLVESTVTQGIIGRVVMASWRESGQRLNILQHGAAVNSGNSGGPLLDLCGRVVGVNTAKALGEVAGSLGKGLEVNQTDGIFFASHVAVLVEALKDQGVNALVTGDGCAPGTAPAATYTVASSAQPGWYLPTAIAAALLAAVVALFVSLRKTTAIQETYTQFKRRKGPSAPTPDAPASVKSWTFRGRGSRGQVVELVINVPLLEKGPLIIGREALHCQLAIDDPTVSRQHAKLSLMGGRLQLVDLGSTNGTLIDAEPVTTSPITLRRGQTLTLGKVILTIDRAAS